MCLFSLTVRDNTRRLGVIVMRERVCMPQEYADSMGIDFFETSAKANYNVEEAFKHLAREIRSTCARVAPAATSRSSNRASPLPHVVAILQLRARCPPSQCV